MSGGLNLDSLFDDTPKETIIEEESKVHPSEVKDENGNVLAERVEIKNPERKSLDYSTPEDAAENFTREQQEEDEGISLGDDLFAGESDTPALPPNGEVTQEKPPEIQDVMDFDKIPKEQHAQMMELAKLMNIKTINVPAIVSPTPSGKAKKATSLEIFDEGMAGNMKDAKTFWRASRRKTGRDILFDGIPLASQFEDQIEDAIKEKHQDVDDDDFHFYCYVFFALSIPVTFTRENKYARSILEPKDFNRVLVKDVREKLGIEVVFTTFGNRSDAVWWKAYSVNSQEEIETSIAKAHKLIEAAKKVSYTINFMEPECGIEI